MIKPGFIRFLNRFVIKVMERRIGNKFELNDTTLTVVESKDANCDYCFLFQHHLSCSNELPGLSWELVTLTKDAIIRT